MYFYEVAFQLPLTVNDGSVCYILQIIVHFGFWILHQFLHLLPF